MGWRSTLRRWRRWFRRVLHGDVEKRGAPELRHIKHVVVLMLENRSFDHVLGSLGPKVNGVTPEMSNPDLHGKSYPVGPLRPAQVSSFTPSPPHEKEFVAQQIEKMDGFVQAYQRKYPEAANLEPGDVMLHMDATQQPVTYFLAEEFTICNQWFSAVPTDTIPNRLYSLAGDAGNVTSTSPDLDLTQMPDLDSIFEQLDPEHWMLFSGSIPLAFAVSPIRTIGLDHDRWHPLSKFAEMVPHLPQLTWIDPTYYWLDVADGLPRRFVHVDDKFPIPNDDHPPSHTERGQELIRYIYESLIAHPDVWAGTVFVVVYDEHGGFYDHIAPPAIEPDERSADGFVQRGPRVPALIVSPFASRGAVCSSRFDHCSILKFLCDWLGLPKWTKRIASPHIASIAEALTTTARTDIPQVPGVMELPTETPPASSHSINLPRLVASIQKAAHAHNRKAYEAIFPEARTHPPGTAMPPLPTKS